MIRSSRRPRTASVTSPPSASATSAKPRGKELAVSANKTIAASAADTLAAFTDARRRTRWLAGVKISVRGTPGPRSVRLTCEEDGSEIEVRITPKGRARSAVAVKHTKLASAQIVAERRHCWKEMLACLRQYLEGTA